MSAEKKIQTNIQNSTLNLSFDALSKWHDPHIKYWFVYFSIFKGGGWVHSVSFSANGNKLAWVGHDSSISVADATKENAVFNFKTKFLPFLSCIWIAPNTILAAGHGCAPLIFHQGYRDWVVSYLLNTSYLTNSYIVFTRKMESVPKITIFGIKMMVKIGLQKIFLKFLHAEAIFF